MRGHAYRRHQDRRAKGRATRRLRTLGLSPTPRLVGRWAIDRTPCSCPLCGNPRRHEGAETRQETLSACRLIVSD